eukprot:RCo046896
MMLYDAMKRSDEESATLWTTSLVNSILMTSLPCITEKLVVPNPQFSGVRHVVFFCPGCIWVFSGKPNFSLEHHHVGVRAYPVYLPSRGFNAPSIQHRIP